MVNSRHVVIARCRRVEEVVEAVQLAGQAGLDLAVRSGGHSAAGMSSGDGGLFVDVRPMNDVSIDSALRVARVGGGATWGEFDTAAQEFGLATTGGRISTTGVSGLTLGGGSGWLERKYGLACDNLLSVELVLADGNVVTASETSHPDLFWALHGGGGNFGVATSFDFRLHPVGPTVLAGLLLWPAEAGADLVSFYRDFAAGAPDELGSAAGFITGPAADFVPEALQGTICAVVALCYAGPIEEGEAMVQALRRFGPPAADLVGPMPYASFQSLLDDASPAGRRNYWTTDHLDEVSDDAVAAFVAHAGRMASPHGQCVLIPWGGAVGRLPEEATPLAQRGAAWVRAFTTDMKPFGSDRIRATYGKHYDRLAQIKAEYDSSNLFSPVAGFQALGGCSSHH